MIEIEERSRRAVRSLVAAAALALIAVGVGCGRETRDEHAGHEPAEHEHAAGEAGETAGAEAALCSEHNVPEDECGICRPELAASLAPGRGVKVRLPAEGSAEMIGLRTATPEVGAAREAIECLAELAFDRNKLAEITAPVGGIVRSARVDLGEKVAKGEVLAEIWSPEIAEIAAEAVLAHQRLDRARELHAGGMTSDEALDEAEAEHRAVCQKARTFGFTEDDVAVMAASPEEAVLLTVRAPFAGEIIDRTAVQGERVDARRSLYLLGDRSSIWAMLALPETDLAHVRVGQTVEVEADALPGETFEGRLTWIAARVDDRTRLVEARAELANPNGLLRDKMFGRARILTRAESEALLVPAGAVQTVEGRSLVFVKLAEDLYEARAVFLGAEGGGRREVLLGVRPTEEIAVDRSFALKSQLLSSRLGAGCADD